MKWYQRMPCELCGSQMSNSCDYHRQNVKLPKKLERKFYLCEECIGVHAIRIRDHVKIEMVVGKGKRKFEECSYGDVESCIEFPWYQTPIKKVRITSENGEIHERSTKDGLYIKDNEKYYEWFPLNLKKSFYDEKLLRLEIEMENYKAEKVELFKYDDLIDFTFLREKKKLFEIKFYFK